jgi:hypothetical protein
MTTTTTDDRAGLRAQVAALDARQRELDQHIRVRLNELCDNVDDMLGRYRPRRRPVLTVITGDGKPSRRRKPDLRVVQR